MYCRKCGTIVKDGLKYCNNCGERLSREDRDDTPGRMLRFLLRSMILTTVISLGILIGLVTMLLSNGMRQELVAVIALAYLALVLAIGLIPGLQIPKLINAKLRVWESDSDGAERRELSHQPVPQLDEYRTPVGSVTERTTRTLDKVSSGER